MRVHLKGERGTEHRGWALNVSRGGVRVILEENVPLGSEFLVTLSTGADPATSFKGRVVWVQEEPDGVVCGIEVASFEDGAGGCVELEGVELQMGSPATLRPADRGEGPASGGGSEP